MSSQIKTIIFDLDGTLVDTCDIHYKALNEALCLINSKYKINLDEHLSIFNGLNTKKKLEILHETKGLSKELFNNIFEKKQELTEKYIKELVKEDNKLKEILEKLKILNIKIYCATNCIRKIGLLILERLGILNLFDAIYTNEDVKYPKPNNEMYFKCINDSGCMIDECIIFEDSPLGIKGAKSTGCKVIEVNTPNWITMDNIMKLL